MKEYLTSDNQTIILILRVFTVEIDVDIVIVTTLLSNPKKDSDKTCEISIIILHCLKFLSRALDMII